MADDVKEILAVDQDTGRTYYEVQPYQEVRLAGMPWVVYHQGDEEQTAVVDQSGGLLLMGPNDWTVRHEARAAVPADR